MIKTGSLKCDETKNKLKILLNNDLTVLNSEAILLENETFDLIDNQKLKCSKDGLIKYGTDGCDEANYLLNDKENKLKIIKEKIELLNKGEEIKQQTRGWDDNHGRNYTMREKEDANDYRYFPDPDILAINISREQVENIRKTMPESKQSRFNRYKDFGLSDYDIDIITSERYISDYFDKLTEITNEPKESANWVMTDLLRVQKESVQLDLEDIISVENLAEIIKLVLLGKITRVNSKVLFDSVVSTGKDVATLVKELGLSGDVSDDDIVAIVKSLLQEKPNLYDDYKLEPDNIINFVVGNIMRVTKGRANVEKIKPIIISMLEN
jgi:aspartyl-tRNA(Asn)/glutamyl-tRNA(Gln) amidotransferase subunit B